MNNKIIKKLIFTLIVLLPIIFIPIFYSVFSLPKLIVLEVCSLLILFFWGLNVYSEHKIEVRKSAIYLPLFIYAIICVVNTAFSTVFYTSLLGADDRYLGVFTTLTLLTLPIFVINFFDNKDVKKAVNLSFITSSFLALYGVFQYFGVDQKIFQWSQDPTSRVFGTMGHADHFGIYLGMNFILGIYLIKNSKAKKEKIFYHLGELLIFITLILTGSRGALIATILALVYLFFKLGKKYILRSLAAIGIILVIFASALFFVPKLQEISLISRTQDMVQQFQSGHIPDRLSWWLTSLSMIKDKPVFGFGMNTFADIYNAYRRTDYQLPDNIQNLITPEAAHNEYLNIAVTQGIVGLLSFLAILFYALRIKPKNELSSFIKIAMIAFLLQIFVSFSVIGTAFLFYLLMGFLLVESETEKYQTYKLSPLVTKITLPIFFLLLILVGWNMTDSAIADYYYKSGLNTASINANKSMESFEESVEFEPNRYQFLNGYADFLLQLSRNNFVAENTKTKIIQNALIEYEAAIKVNPNHPSTFFNAGLAYLEIYGITKNPNYFQLAKNYFQKSVVLAPNNPIYQSRVDQALKSVTAP